jgi:hypothetical protein
VSAQQARRDDAGAKKLARIIEAQQRQALIVFVAKGGPNACGPGCSEWVAAEGKIDKDAGQRLKEFLASLPRRDLPVFVNSTGGMTGAARQIGASLRAYRTTVGVGRTIPDGCSTGAPIAETCRQLMRSKSEHKARLIVDRAFCVSACVLAIAGGSVRHFERGAQLGIHALRSDIPRQSTIEEAYDRLKLYYLEMGVNPSIIDAGATVGADAMHFMTRGEIARFHLETGDPYESPWLSIRESPQRYAIVKSFTPATGRSSTPPGTRVVKLACDVGGILVWLNVWRELLPNETNVRPGTISLSADDAGVPAGAGPTIDGRRYWQTATSLDLLRRLAAAPKIDVVESPAQAHAQGGAFALSTTGLADALKELNKRCQAPVAGVSSVGSAR